MIYEWYRKEAVTKILEMFTHLIDEILSLWPPIDKFIVTRRIWGLGCGSTAQHLHAQSPAPHCLLTYTQSMTYVQKEEKNTNFQRLKNSGLNY